MKKAFIRKGKKREGGEREHSRKESQKQRIRKVPEGEIQMFMTTKRIV